MSKGNRNFAKPVDEHAEVLTETVEEVVTSSVEESDFEEQGEEAAVVTEETGPKASVMLFGLVTNCIMLNVRTAPSKDANVLCVIESGTHIRVYNDNSDSDFYKVLLNSGEEGYCMKQYITVT